MFAEFHKDLLRPPGRSPRARFIAAWIVAVLSVIAKSYAMEAMGNNNISFLVGLFWTCLNIYLFYSLFSRRLHDMSLSIGPFFVMIILTLFVAAFAAAAGGLSDYFNAIYENPQITQDAEANKALIEKYQADLAANIGWINWLVASPALLLTLFCAIKPGVGEANKYGPVPQNA